ncbi:MAG: hypothetical protein JWR22_4052 [Herminiimonas sp.]|nr:hypothetical protein [Herminiimonas sp.]
MQPHTALRFSDTAPCHLEAVFFLSEQNDVYGWYAEAEGDRQSAAFFMLENFYSDRTPLFYRSLQDDVYGDWVRDQPYYDKVRCPLPEPLRHELERLQSIFVDEWLFFPGDPAAASEASAFVERGLPVQAINIKARRLSRMERLQGEWVYATAQADLTMLDFLQDQWAMAPGRQRR